MGGTPGLTCPECGRTARSEQRLGRTRRTRAAGRRGRWFAAGLLGSVGGDGDRAVETRGRLAGSAPNGEVRVQAVFTLYHFKAKSRAVVPAPLECMKKPGPPNHLR